MDPMTTRMMMFVVYVFYLCGIVKLFTHNVDNSFLRKVNKVWKLISTLENQMTSIGLLHKQIFHVCTQNMNICLIW